VIRIPLLPSRQIPLVFVIPPKHSRWQIPKNINSLHLQLSFGKIVSQDHKDVKISAVIPAVKDA
jgi:hypothetical protein